MKVWRPVTVRFRARRSAWPPPTSSASAVAAGGPLDELGHECGADARGHAEDRCRSFTTELRYRRGRREPSAWPG